MAGQLIFLDTHFLVRGLAARVVSARMMEWIRDGELFCASSIVWYEFSCRPLDAQGLRVGQMLLGGRIVPFVEHGLTLA